MANLPKLLSNGMLEIDDSQRKMLDVLHFREIVLETILSREHLSYEVYELRFALFIRAANYYFKRKQECIEPFPSCFYDPVKKLRRYDDLQKHIAEIPKLSDINEHTSLSESTWELLAWIFTNPLKIKAETKSEISEFLTDELRKETKLMTIPYPTIHSMRFKITHPIEINSTKVFLAHKKKFGSFYAYHGSPCQNFHSIIHRGLRCDLNHRSAYGTGTYLTSHLQTAKDYSNNHRFVNSYCLPEREDVSGDRYCVALVEVIKHPSINVVDFANSTQETINPANFNDTSDKYVKYYVVDNDELMRLKGLLVFG